MGTIYEKSFSGLLKAKGTRRQLRKKKKTDGSKLDNELYFSIRESFTGGKGLC